jgi:hypothetical protein
MATSHAKKSNVNIQNILKDCKIHMQQLYIYLVLYPSVYGALVQTFLKLCRDHTITSGALRFGNPTLHHITSPFQVHPYSQLNVQLSAIVKVHVLLKVHIIANFTNITLS